MNLAQLNPAIFNLAELKAILITLTIVLVYFAINRSITHYRTHRKLNQELAEYDNFAYGLSYAGSIFAFVFIAGAVFGQHSFGDPLQDSFHITLYAILTIGCVEAGRFIHDRFILRYFDENKAINHKNTAGAFIDAASVITNAICVVAIFNWSGPHTIADVVTVISLYLICQLQLLLLTRWREYRYAKNNQGESMQRTLGYENLALSIQHAGYLIAGALAIKITTFLLLYSPGAFFDNISGFVLVGTLVMIFTVIFAAVGSNIVLRGINIESEIGFQDNVGIATVEFSVLVSTALVLLTLAKTAV